MVELKPAEYTALADLLGPELVDSLAGESETTGAFWQLVDRALRPHERAQLRARLTTPKHHPPEEA